MAFPIVVPHHHVRRIADRNATVLILTRRFTVRGDGHPSLYEVHDALTVRRNQRHCHDGRPDLQSDPRAFVIEVLDIEHTHLNEIDQRRARDAGYKTTDELLKDWQARRGAFDPGLEVWAHAFKVVEARFLHRDLHRGYSFDPSQSAGRDEPEAISGVEVERYATAARERFEATREEEMLRRRKRSLKAKLSLAINRGDSAAMTAVVGELGEVQRTLDQDVI